MTEVGDWVGREIADGRYRILDRIGEGSMGHIYRAHDRHLETDVVLKFPVAADLALEGPEFLARFSREIRSLVRLSHPHIVKVIDVGAWEGRPYVVLQYLAGGSLKDRMEAIARPMPPHSLHDWLRPVAEALDFIHAQNHIHRDVKPANILFDQHGNAFLGDFGIIKALAAEGPTGNDLTAPGFLLGTPNYVAPEIVMGKPCDGRVDQYALAMTVHEVLTGANCMAGPTPSATIVNQTNLIPPAPADIIPGVPRRLSDAVLRGLSKDPRDRFESCAAMARAILADVPGETISVLYGPDDRPLPDHSAPTMITPRGGVGGSGFYAAADTGSFVTASGLYPSATSGMVPVLAPVAPAKLATRTPRWAWAGLGLALLVVVIGAVVWANRRTPESRPREEPPAAAAAALAPIEINIVYGTEKQSWLQAAAEEFQKQPRRRPIKINLVGKGSVEGAQLVLNGREPVPYHVWSPASSAYRDVFEQKWRSEHGNNPIFQAENLALTPMVFVMWKERHDAFIKKYGKVSFETIAKAMHEPGGWATIANQPDWGQFKFAHTEPTDSNSGILTLVLMAYEFAKRNHDAAASEVGHSLTLADVSDPKFEHWLQTFEERVARPSGKLTNSTGNLMKEMVQHGPSRYDCLMVYESLAIEKLGAARDRWGEVRVDYPDPGYMNEHPYYILDTPWISADQRAAAAEFLRMLMSDSVQRGALKYGFRPGNVDVPLRVPGSPFVESETTGIKIDLTHLAAPPKANVLEKLLASFRQVYR